MINRNDHQNSDTERPVQRGLFDPPENLVHDPGPAIKAAMREADKTAQQKFSISRENIVDRMNEMADEAGITCNGRARKVTVTIYCKWLSASERHYIPLRLLPIFCRAVASSRPLEVYATFFDASRVIAESDIKKLQWAELEIARRRLTQQARQLAQEVGL